mmetsp:Transcript_22666/g.52853  ORF Transcript_22666/g.52853 Transcript_22666/m.52853 type:complete len:212 (+) Transcript_22666:428-1063(+)
MWQPRLGLWSPSSAARDFRQPPSQPLLSAGVSSPASVERRERHDAEDLTEPLSSDRSAAADWRPQHMRPDASTCASGVVALPRRKHVRSLPLWLGVEALQHPRSFFPSPKLFLRLVHRRSGLKAPGAGLHPHLRPSLTAAQRRSSFDLRLGGAVPPVPTAHIGVRHCNSEFVPPFVLPSHLINLGCGWSTVTKQDSQSSKSRQSAHQYRTV